ncbi:hypothetical protein PUNSTDRAFT_134596 [Punctularia strigosozonata HHB-11173 SS5]|uniref:uncharacterized protein n=1 Tax=Punctularia strigosozonata (strain HHB-11173) TaxID=741275 RepID=UPI0004417A36|nr:uncharacterized protein PUNSTDRAFT_134596 [Punctularia strigosozonata HHB-11173 SS5]EIN08205.1 hypothetical protein PUNSTDRAFT_134596 [Punctularia strigosozonata HHB-11173 SS5]
MKKSWMRLLRLYSEERGKLDGTQEAVRLEVDRRLFRAPGLTCTDKRADAGSDDGRLPSCGDKGSIAYASLLTKIGFCTFFRLLCLTKNKPTATRARKAIPPTTPPTMAPVLFECLDVSLPALEPEPAVCKNP